MGWPCEQPDINCGNVSGNRNFKILYSAAKQVSLPTYIVRNVDADMVDVKQEYIVIRNSRSQRLQIIFQSVIACQRRYRVSGYLLYVAYKRVVI